MSQTWVCKIRRLMKWPDTSLLHVGMMCLEINEENWKIIGYCENERRITERDFLDRFSISKKIKINIMFYDFQFENY